MQARVTHMLKIQDDSIYLPTPDGFGIWYPALVEVEFNFDPEGRVIMNTPTQPPVEVNLTTEEWRAINRFVEKRLAAQKGEQATVPPEPEEEWEDVPDGRFVHQGQYVAVVYNGRLTGAYRKMGVEIFDGEWQPGEWRIQRRKEKGNND